MKELLKEESKRIGSTIAYCLFIFLLVVILTFLFSRCSEDSPVTNNPTPPTADSTVELISPPNDTIFYLPINDSIFIHFSWTPVTNPVVYQLDWYIIGGSGTATYYVYRTDTTLIIQHWTDTTWYSWRVRAWYNYPNVGPWSPNSYFYLQTP